jgi:hypothetical protein
MPRHLYVPLLEHQKTLAFGDYIGVNSCGFARAGVSPHRAGCGWKLLQIGGSISRRSETEIGLWLIARSKSPRWVRLMIDWRTKA